MRRHHKRFPGDAPAGDVEVGGRAVTECVRQAPERAEEMITAPPALLPAPS